MFVFRSIIFHNRLDLLKMKGQIMDKKIIVLLSGCILAVFLLAGCGNDEVSSEYNIEYLNKDKTKIVDVPYEPETSDTDGMIKEFLAKLSSDSDNVEYRKPIPNGVEVTDYSLDGVMLSIHFDADYSSMTEVEEVLCRAAVVLTMTQISGVDCVSFYVADAPLTDIRGNIVGSMNQDSFIENPGEQINSIQCTTLKLYFANETGDGLVEETRSDVYYSSNVSMEKLIMEQLLEGPQTEEAKSAIPAGTKLINVSVVDGVCYVSLDENFKNQDYQVNEAVVIYSIVDSLTELSTISKVQISVNGDTSGTYRDNFKLSDMYDRNLDYVVSLEETGVTEEE